MKKTTRQVLAIIALVLMVPCIAFTIMALGAYKGLGGISPALAGALFVAVLILFLIIKMDDARKKKSEQKTASVQNDLKSGEQSLDKQIEAGTATEVVENEQSDAPAEEPKETVLEKNSINSDSGKMNKKSKKK